MSYLFEIKFSALSVEDQHRVSFERNVVALDAAEAVRKVVAFFSGEIRDFRLNKCQRVGHVDIE